MKKEYCFLMLMLVCCCSWAVQLPSDSSVLKPPSKKNTLSVVTRVHSMGIFWFMGKVVNYNPAADVFITYKSRSNWGFAVFKVADLRDIHSHNNFAFAMINKALKVGPRLTLTPNVGIALEQQNKFADHGSDAMIMLTSTFRINKNVLLEHHSIFNNLLFETTYSDWTNRARIVFSKAHLDISGLFWHNNRLIDHESYFSTGASVFYNRIPVGKKTWFGGGISGFLTASQSNPEVPHNKRGIQITASLSIK